MARTDTQRLVGALADWAASRGYAPEAHRYGEHPDQTCDLSLPAGRGPHPLLVLLHGGFWRARFDRTTMVGLAADLGERGWATWNVEYRRVGTGGGPVETVDDVRAAIATAAELPGRVSADQLVVVGHSAGGQLALLAADLPSVTAVVSLAGVCDLRSAARERIGEGAALEFVGGTPEERPELYERADPLSHQPARARVLLVHGDSDSRVPVEQSRAYAAAAAASGADCELLELPGVDHFELIDPRSATWETVAGRLRELAG